MKNRSLWQGTILLFVSTLAALGNAAALATHTTAADFELGSHDGQARVDTIGAVKLRNQATAVGTYTQVSRTPTTFRDGSIFATEGRIFVLGGISGWAGTQDSMTQIYSATFDSAGITSGFSLVGNLPGKLGNNGFARWGRWVYMAGGITTGSPSYSGTNVVYRAEVQPGGILGPFTLAGTLPATSVAGILYAAAGDLFFNNYAVTTLYTAPIRGDGSFGSWSTSSALPSTRSNPWTCENANRLWAFGGSGPFTTQILTADASGGGILGAWTPAVQTLTVASRNSSGSPSAGHGSIFLQGGDNGSALNSTKLAALLSDGSLGAWSSSSLLTARASGATLVTEGALWLFGGHDFSANHDEVYRAPLTLSAAFAPKAAFRGQFDLGIVQTLVSLDWDASSGVSLRARAAPNTAIYTAWSAYSISGSIPLAGSYRYVEYEAILADSGSGASLDEVRVIDVPPTATPSITPSDTPSITMSVTPSITPTITLTPTVPPATITPEPPAPEAEGLARVYPNPSMKGVTHFAFKMAESGKARVSVWTSAAQRAAGLEGSFSAGKQQMDLDVSAFAEGIYLYRLTLEYDSGRKMDGPLGRFAVIR